MPAKDVTRLRQNVTPTSMIRDERPGDEAAIGAVNRAAFGREAEATLVAALRRDEALIASRVAVEDGRIVGHILFSKVWIESADETRTVASLAPMAVAPGWQRRGIGTALVRDGLEVCRARRYAAVIVVGHPAYYPRFGFSTAAVARLSSPYAGEAFMGLEWVSGVLTASPGRVRYPAAFDALG
jgi:putative acetyltransferase